jgi:hypothetical protein
MLMKLAALEKPPYSRVSLGPVRPNYPAGKAQLPGPCSAPMLAVFPSFLSGHLDFLCPGLLQPKHTMDVPSTRQIVISGDVICDETFASTVAETWKPFHDALALRPTASFITDSYTVLEHTGDLLSQFEEGNATANGYQTETTSPFEEDIIHSDLISDPVEDSSEEEATEGTEESHEAAGSSDTVPQIVDDGLDTNTR